MAKKTNEEEVKTLSAEETAEEVNDTENNGATITLDDDSGVRPLAADDYVENFEVGGKTYAVRDVEAQDSITQLNSDSIQCVHLSSSDMQTLDDFVKATDGDPHGAFFRINDSNKCLLPEAYDWVNGVVWYQNSYDEDANVRGCAICKPQSDDTLYKVIISGTSSAGFTSNSCELIDANTCLKVTNYSVNLQNMTWNSTSFGQYTFTITVSGSILAIIPVIEFAGDRRMVAYLRTAFSSSVTSVTAEVWQSSDVTSTPTYGTLRLYVLYTA